MDETSAMQVVAVRAIETTDTRRALWSDADRSWASRAAAEVVGAEATPDAFLARRSALAIERIGEHHPALPRAVRALRWRSWVGASVIGFAFALGVFVDQVDDAKRINILAPPVLGLLVWNLAVYVAIVAGYVVRYGEAGPFGPLRGAIARLAGGAVRPRGAAAMRDAIVAFGEDWARRSVPLYGVRVARILHVAAALLAAGVIAGLYTRGIAFEYRASWESTFLDAPTVRAIIAFAHAPGSFVTGIPIPSVDEIVAIHAPGGENAARWLHLIASTVVVIVIVPRLLLALFAGVIERRRAAQMPLALDEPYFQRLLRGYRGGPAQVRVIPYSYSAPPAALEGLQSVVARAFGGSAAMIVAPPVAYGAEASVPGVDAKAPGVTLLALFNATATPERETHGAFLAALRERHKDAAAPIALIDESAFLMRWKHEPARLADRRSAWRQACEAVSVPAVFIDLADPDLAAADAALDAALGEGAP